MPAPDPNGIYVEKSATGWRATAEVWQHSNVRSRTQRLHAIGRNLQRDGWKCRMCGETICEVKRADARFCSEWCRKKRARMRRRVRQSWCDDDSKFVSD